MKKWFSLGEISKYHIISLFIPFFYLATTYVQRDVIIENEGENNNPYNKNYQLPYFIIIFFSKTFAGFLYLISKYIINKNLLSSKLLSLRSKRIYHLNINSKKKLKIILLILVISFFEVFYNLEHIKTLKIKSLIEMKIGFIFFIPIISYFILKTKYYRHHFVSLIIVFIGFIFIILSLIISNENDKNNEFDVGQQIKHFLYSITFSLSIVLICYLLRYYFINPFAFLFFDGIFCILFSFIFILLEYINNSDIIINNFKNFFIVFKTWKIFFLFLCILLFSFIYYISTVITLYLFNPTLFVMTDILFPILRWIIDTLVILFSKDKSEKINKTQSIFEFIGYIFLIVACALFNEIIICNFWNLNYNTYQEIKQRGIEDAKENVKENNESILSTNESILSIN